MKLLNLKIAVFCLVALAALFVSSTAKADTWNKATKMTFPEAVRVSSTVLQPATYWFQLMLPVTLGLIEITCLIIVCALLLLTFIRLLFWTALHLFSFLQSTLGYKSATYADQRN